MNYGNKRAEDAAAAAGLPPGRMMTMSKSGYRARNPDNIAVFNATITDLAGVGLWWGDLDITVDEERLKQLASTLETQLLVFYEGHARLADTDADAWIFETGPATFLVDPESGVTLAERVSEHAVRNEEGKLVRRRPA